MVSIMYARRPAGESHNAKDMVCGRSGDCLDAPGVSGGVIPETGTCSCMGDDGNSDCAYPPGDL